MDISEKVLSRLTDEQKKKAENAESPEELLAIAKEAGFELSREQMDDLAGGSKWDECSSKSHSLKDFTEC